MFFPNASGHAHHKCWSGAADPSTLRVNRRAARVRCHRSLFKRRRREKIDGLGLLENNGNKNKRKKGERIKERK